MIKKTIKNKACKIYDTTNTKCTTSNEERSTNITTITLT
ncbi:hypothetical protein PFMALIP_05808 [Plasmodium falciparum MaliPS096_E11]|uniref:Uncharacterized protein n=1 Tax=Plasmodium falciparum MaliPS096_E11 TaxID=1036727 RepID=A0A024WGL2_PLAFA|nr:hypothetical protein PFMALIP_05808 [Plasmodium falciparum MaliPS096_E11]